MDAGWCWRIDHEQSINRGYVYSSAAMSDDQAREEFLRKNPNAKTWDHVVKFKTGRYARGWVDNVMGIGNASGFVEPLESTALMVVCWQSKILVDFLWQTGLSPTPTIRKLFNTVWAATWDEIRDFLTLHYWANTKLDTPFWKHCRADTDISRLGELLEFYDENGPTGFCPLSPRDDRQPVWGGGVFGDAGGESRALSRAICADGGGVANLESAAGAVQGEGAAGVGCDGVPFGVHPASGVAMGGGIIDQSSYGSRLLRAPKIRTPAN